MSPNESYSKLRLNLGWASGRAAGTTPGSEEADQQLRSALVAVVGPIGERIYADVEAVAAPLRLEAAVKALRSYGVPEDLIEELRRTHRPGPGSPAPGDGP